MKPHDWTRAIVQHRVGTDRGDPQVEQPWRDELAEPLLHAAAVAAERLGRAVHAVEPGSNERLRLAVTPHDEDAIRGVALCCNAIEPALWLTVGKLAVSGGRFWRRERGRLLNYRVAKDVGLTRETRQLLRDLLKPKAIA